MEQIQYVNLNNWISGIYRITAPNGDYYYGSSCNFNKRWKNSHINRLKEKTHENVYMQNVFNKYPAGWLFEAIERVEPVSSILENIEQKYLDLYYGKPGCMNINPFASRPPSPKGKVGYWCNKKQSPEHIEKRAAAQRGKPNIKSSINNLGNKNGAGNKGRKRTIESRLKMSLAQTGKKWPIEKIIKRQLTRLDKGLIKRINVDPIVLQKMVNSSILPDNLLKTSIKYLNTNM